MPLNVKKKLAVGGAVVAAAGLAGGAYAASSSSTNPRQTFLDDVAKRLNVSPAQLNSALKGAYQDQLDQAVKSGRLTQAQANKLKQRLAQRPLAPVGPWGFHHGGFFGRGMGVRAGLGDAAAKYLGITETQLVSQLRSGKSLADIANAQHKSVSGLEDALKSAIKARLDKAVAAKAITSAQEQKILSRVDQRLSTIVNRKGFGPGMMHRGFRAGGMMHPGFGAGGMMHPGFGAGGMMPPGVPGP